MMGVVLVSLLLQPVLAESGDVRLAAEGTGDAPVYWWVDGQPMGMTTGDAMVVSLDAGPHRIEARTTWQGPWMAMARPSPPTGEWLHVESYAQGAPPARAIPAPGVLFLGILLALAKAKTP